MSAAQKLFEKGLITYMRTDSFNLSEQALAKIRELIQKDFGVPYLPPQILKYKNRSKLAQEAHEAIRPTDVFNKPDKVDLSLEEDEKKIYALIWKRTVACQMNKAVYRQHTCDIATCNLKTNYLFRATGSMLLFNGWKAVYAEENGEVLSVLPTLKVGDGVDLKELFPMQKFTKPPARYTEASLIKALEDYDIGRPSTYAPTIATILERLYVDKEER